MWLYVLIAALALAIYVLMQPGENSGGDATLFLRNDKDQQLRQDEIKLRREQLKKEEAENANKYNETGKQVLILYGTAYGFAERLAKKLHKQIKKKTAQTQLQPRIVNMKNFTNYIDLTQESAAIVICSTAGDGVPPADARAFVDYMGDLKQKLENLHVAVLALGDSNYPHFCKAGKTLAEQFSAAHAQHVVPLQLVDKEDWTVIDAWFANIDSVLKNLDIKVQSDYLQARSLVLDSDGFNRNNPYNAHVIKNILLTKTGRYDDKEIIHVDVDLGDSALSYEEGDALGIVPLNNPPEVNLILQAISRKGTDIVTIEGKGEVTLREALTEHFDIKNTQQMLLQTLATRSSDAKEKRLLDAAVLNKDFFQGKELYDVLASFPKTARDLPNWKLVEQLRPLQPRYYSISSSPAVNPKVASITAGVIRYNINGRPGTGVATTFLADRLRCSQQLKVFISVNRDFRLPSNPATPIIMIGPGTGLAPFRAFLQKRVADCATGENLLYFGCRHRDRDFIYRDELEQYERDGHVTLRLAFSRDQKEKIYVQHLLQQDGQSVWTLLQRGAHVYICGDGANMAKDVDNALLELLQRHGGMSAAQAENYLANLASSGRYEKDVWIT